MKVLVPALLMLCAAGCGNDLPAYVSYHEHGDRIEIIGKARMANGDQLLVRSMRCPWDGQAWAAFQVSGGYDPARICLVFTSKGARESLRSGGTEPLVHSPFSWAPGWAPDPVDL